MFKYQSNGEAWLWPPHILHRLTGISIYDGLPFKGGKVFLGQASAENLLRKTESLSKVFCPFTAGGFHLPFIIHLLYFLVFNAETHIYRGIHRHIYIYLLYSNLSGVPLTLWRLYTT